MNKKTTLLLLSFFFAAHFLIGKEKQQTTTIGFEKNIVELAVSKKRTDTLVNVFVACYGKGAAGIDFTNVLINCSDSRATIKTLHPNVNFIPGSDTVLLGYSIQLKLDTNQAGHELFPLSLSLKKGKEGLSINKNVCTISITKKDPNKKHYNPVSIGFEHQVILVTIGENFKDTVIPVKIISTGENPEFKADAVRPVTKSPELSIEGNPTVRHSDGKDTIIVLVKIQIKPPLTGEQSYKLSMPAINKPEAMKISNAEVIIHLLKKEVQAQKKYSPTTTFVTYSDFKGFKGDQPNGLVQFETNFNYYFKQKEFDKSKAQTIWLRNTIIGINLTKLDDKLRYRQLDYDTIDQSPDTIRHIHTFDLVRYSNFNFYIKTNIFTFNMPGAKLRLFGDLYAGLYSTGVRDSLLEDEKEFNLNSTGFGASMKIATNYRQNESPFNASFGITGFLISAHSNNVRQRVGPLYYPETDIRNKQFAKNGVFGGKTMTIFQLELRYSPSSDLNRNGKIFLRTSYYTNVFYKYSDGANSSDYGNNFLQVQIGYVGTIEDLLSRFFPENTDTGPKEVQTGKL